MPLAITMTASRSPSAGPQASAYADPSEWASTANRPRPRWSASAPTARGQSANPAARGARLSPYPGRSTPIIRTPAAVSSPGGNIHPGTSRELDVPWKAKHGTPSGSPNTA